MNLQPFHLAVQVRDLQEARIFYGKHLGLPEGRSSSDWVDFNLFGHQFVVHHNPLIGKNGKITNCTNPVDGHGVPVPHFGVVLEMEDWLKLVEQCKTFVKEFLVEPYIRFKGEPGEQATMFFSDPSGNYLEFKAFKNIEKQLFEI